MQQAPVVSPDGYWMWNGAEWVPNSSTPAAAQPPTVSPDGLWVWNGSQWVANAFQVIVPYASASLRAMLTTLFIAINVVGILLFIAFDVLDAMRVTQGAPDGSSLDVAESLVALLAVVAYYGSFISAVVLFCMWLHRIVRNMPSLGAPDPTFSPGVAVGLCFVPFLNLVQPLLSVIDAWRASPSDRRWLARDARRSVPISMVIVGWWAAWVVAHFVTWAGYFISQSKETAIAAAAVDVAGNIVLIGAAALAILVVRRLTARQEMRNQLIAGGQLA